MEALSDVQFREDSGFAQPLKCLINQGNRVTIFAGDSVQLPGIRLRV
jgi:hypothetical protein